MKKQDVPGGAIEVLETAAIKAGGWTHAMLDMPGVGEALQVVGCDIAARPRDAPMFDDVKPHIIAVRRAPQRLTVGFHASAAEQVEAYVAAERSCCGSQLAFNLIPGDPVVMQIDATQESVDVIEGWMTAV